MTQEPSNNTHFKIGCISAVAIIIAAIIGLGVPITQRLVDIYLPLPPTSIAVVETNASTPAILATTIPQIQAINTTALSRCELIKQNFPQSLGAISEKFGIPVNSIFDVNHENCGGDIIDGFVYRSNQEVELDVPNGGCIDAPPNAFFSDATVSNGVGGSRAYSGKVRASAITYRMYCYK
jgi:hypothetical protein